MKVFARQPRKMTWKFAKRSNVHSSMASIFLRDSFRETNSSPPKSYWALIGRESSNYQFSGTMVVSGRDTWRIIPGLGYVVNNHGDRKSPKDRFVGPLPNGLFMSSKWGLLTTY